MRARPTLAFSQSEPAAAAHHRLANSVSMVAGLVRMQALCARGGGQVDRDEVRIAPEEVGGRVETVARLHRLLSNTPLDAMVELGEYLGDISRAIVSALSFAGGVELRLECEGRCPVSARQALPVGLIVIEVVTNAVKYAHPSGVRGMIGIGCRRTSTQAILVEVSDDGVGLPEGFDPVKDGHLGLGLVRTMAAQIAAQIDFVSTPLGLSFTLQMASGASP